MVPARFVAHIGSHDGVIHGFIPGVVGLVHHLDMSQVLHAEGRFPAGDYHPDRVTLLNTHRLAILAIGHDTVVHGLCQGPPLRKPASSPLFSGRLRSTTRKAALRSIRCNWSSPIYTGPATPCWDCLHYGSWHCCSHGTPGNEPGIRKAGA